MGPVISQTTQKYKQLSKLIDEVNRAPFPLDASDSQIIIIAQNCAADCQRLKDKIADQQKLTLKLIDYLAAKTVPVPETENDQQFISRCIDAAFWRRNLRKIHGRVFEHVAVRLGLVSVRSGAYCSNETVARHIASTQRNQKNLDQVKMQNQTTDQIYSLKELSSKTTANQVIRHGELMLRMAGCEQIAAERGDIGLFITQTAPSRFHAMLSKSGELNPKYEGATPRQTAQHLGEVWARCRAELARSKIFPYGFRIAEPHHDGCPHWHMMMFVATDQAAAFSKIITRHAIAADRNELENKAGELVRVDARIKIVEIDSEKGSACAYISKYVSKNISGDHVAEHIDADGVISAGVDLAGGGITKPFQRVQAWASCWGIRQFQAIGQPPVTGWREMRRVSEEVIDTAPAHIKEAWAACQRVELKNKSTGEIVSLKPANFADYIKAQGGVCIGRKYKIGVATHEEQINGRYGLALASVPVGIYARSFKGDLLLAPKAIYESNRYKWKRIGFALEVDVCLPWSPVNNCTYDEEAREVFWAKELPESAFDDFEGIDFYENFEKIPDSWDCSRKYDKDGMLKNAGAF